MIFVDIIVSMEIKENDKIVLGIHYGHDATVCLLINGVIVEAMSEERLSRQKKHMGFPHLSLAYLKDKYLLEKLTNIKIVVVGDLKFVSDTIFKNKEDNLNIKKAMIGTRHYLRSIGMRFSIVGFLFSARDRLLNLFLSKRNSKEKILIYLEKQLSFLNIQREDFIFIDHHLAHAYAAIPFMSDHRERLIFTADGAGDDVCHTINRYKDGQMEVLSSTNMQYSLGLLYSGVVDLLGMTRNEHEFKVMGLAPYAKASSGEKVYQKMKKLVWFNHHTMTFESSFFLPRSTEYMIANEYFKYRFDSLAYGVQKLTEELLKEMVSSTINKYSINDIAIGGGVFMNVKANQHVLVLKEVNSLVSTPSCGDESLAIGAAVYGYIKSYDYKDIKQASNIYWGSEYDNKEIEITINNYKFESKITFKFCDVKNKSIEKEVAELLSQNQVVGRFSGRAEWGARALGNRSILANPSSRDNVKLINEMIKNRDFWMPFATSLKEERVKDYLLWPQSSLLKNKDLYAPYMSITFETTELAHMDLPAALHPYDHTSRPQIVSKKSNEKYWNLIDEFEKLTAKDSRSGIGGVLNTSFNLHGEPNVETPFDALRTFDLSGMKYLAIGDYLVSKI